LLIHIADHGQYCPDIVGAMDNRLKNGALVFLFEGREQDSAPIDLSSDPVKLAEKWLEVEKKC